jgi:branched-chain amino acid transport system substrate-binding protein
MSPDLPSPGPGIHGLSRALPAVLALLAMGCSSGEMRVVAIVPETGHLAAYGEDVKRGLQLAETELTAKGGLLEDFKQPLILDILDDGSNADRSVQEVNKALTEDPPFAIVGPLHGEAWLGQGLDAEEAGVALVSPWVSVPTNDHEYKTLFRTYPSDEIEAARLTKVLRRDLTPRVKDIVVITELSDYGRGYKAAFGRAFKRLQGNVETSLYYERGLQAADAAALVEDLRLKPAGGVLLISTGPDYATLLEALRGIEYQEQIFAVGSFHQPDVRALAGESAQDVLYVAPVWKPESKHARKFAAAYRDEYGEQPTLWSALGYDALTAVAQGAVVMGGAYRSDLSGLMRSLDFEAPGVTSGTVRFDTAGECSDCPLELYGVRDGTALSWDSYKEFWEARYGAGS